MFPIVLIDDKLCRNLKGCPNWNRKIIRGAKPYHTRPQSCFFTGDQKYRKFDLFLYRICEILATSFINYFLIHLKIKWIHKKMFWNSNLGYVMKWRIAFNIMIKISSKRYRVQFKILEDIWSFWDWNQIVQIRSQIKSAKLGLLTRYSAFIWIKIMKLK